MRIYCLLVFLLWFNCGYAQEGKSGLLAGDIQGWDQRQSEFFILGTLSDYMGRWIEPSSVDRLEKFDRLEEPLAETIDVLLKKQYTGMVYRFEKYRDKEGKPLSFYFHSDTLSRRFNAYYNFKADGSSSGGQSRMNGRLKENIFKDDKDKLAFLAGVFVRFSQKNDTAYSMNIANSISKAQVCYTLLEELGCKPYYRIARDYIPVGHWLYFHPTPEVKAYLQTVMPIRDELDQVKMAWIKGIVRKE
jgi:hypothetical protein